VSDVYASTLWGLAHGMSVASRGIGGVYFHGAIGQCDDTSTGFNWYTPLCAPTLTDYRKGNLRPQPLYYALLALGSLPGGHFARVDNPNARTLHVYAVKTDTQLVAVIVNTDHDGSSGSTDVQLEVQPDAGASYQHASQVLLSQRDNDVEVSSGIAIGGAMASKVGSMPRPETSTVVFDGTAAKVTLPPASAVVLTLS
jgi:hypothetical protein